MLAHALTIDGGINMMTTIHLHGDSPEGIRILLDRYGDILDPRDANTAVVRVIGHAVYACSLEEARNSLRRQALMLAPQLFYYLTEE